MRSNVTLICMLVKVERFSLTKAFAKAKKLMLRFELYAERSCGQREIPCRSTLIREWNCGLSHFRPDPVPARNCNDRAKGVGGPRLGCTRDAEPPR